MAEQDRDAPEGSPEGRPEGWDVRHRPALIAAAVLPTVIFALLLIAGHFYNADLRQKTWRPVTGFPRPGLETFIHDGGEDPRRPHPIARPDPSIAAAKHAVATQGLPGWEPAR